MSLQQLATHAAQAGRHGDSTLVHMSPQEVAGLQSLALKHGTSMTINPHTGLPEAFNLKSLLPVAAGALLGPAGFGLFETALGAATAVGGISALSSGSLTKGLMDGLGAYGGANLASGFSAVGADAARNAAGQNAASAGATGDALASARSAALSEATASPFSTMASGMAEPSKLGAAMGGWGNVAGAALPVLGPMLADQDTQTVTKMPSNGYIRNFDYDPLTQTSRAYAPVKTSSLGYAAGGTTDVKTVTQMPGTPTGSSKSAFDYLMGLTNTTHPATTPTAPSINGAGRYVWDAATKSYKWIDASPTVIAPVAANGTGTGSIDPNANQGASSNSSAATGTSSNSNSMGLSSIAAALGLSQDINSVPVSMQDTMSQDAAAQSAAADSSSPASDSAATATTGPSGTLLILNST